MRLHFIIAVLFAALSAGCAQSEMPGARVQANQNLVVIEAASGQHNFDVEIADTNEKRRTGLMYRESLAANAGMLFDFDVVQPVSIWMKNTLIPLDIAFIDEKGVIKRITANATPKSLTSMPSGAPVLAVLEVNGGTFARLGIEEGDIVRHPIFSP